MLSALTQGIYQDTLQSCKVLLGKVSTFPGIRKLVEIVTAKWILGNATKKDPFMTSATLFFEHATAIVRGEIGTVINMNTLLYHVWECGQELRDSPNRKALAIYTRTQMESLMLTKMVKPWSEQMKTVISISQNESFKKSIKCVVDIWIEKQLWKEIPALKFAMFFYGDAVGWNKDLTPSDELTFQRNFETYRKGFRENVIVDDDAKREGLSLYRMLNSTVSNATACNFQWGDTERLTSATYGEIGVEEQMLLLFVKPNQQDYFAACQAMQKVLTDMEFLTMAEKVLCKWEDAGMAGYACELIRLMIEFAMGPMSKTSADEYHANCSLTGVVTETKVMAEYDIFGGVEPLRQWTSPSQAEIHSTGGTVSEKMFRCEEEAMGVIIAAKYSGKLLSTRAIGAKNVMLKIQNLKGAKVYVSMVSREPVEKQVEKQGGKQQEVEKEVVNQMAESVPQQGVFAQKEAGKQKEVEKQQGYGQNGAAKQRGVGVAGLVNQMGGSVPDPVPTQGGGNAGTRSKNPKKVNPKP